MQWALESGAITIGALLILAIEVVILRARGALPGDVAANLASGAALLVLVGLLLSGKPSWPIIAALMTAALVAHVAALVLRFSR